MEKRTNGDELIASATRLGAMTGLNGATDDTKNMMTAGVSRRSQRLLTILHRILLYLPLSDRLVDHRFRRVASKDRVSHSMQEEASVMLGHRALVLNLGQQSNGCGRPCTWSRVALIASSPCTLVSLPDVIIGRAGTRCDAPSWV